MKSSSSTSDRSNYESDGVADLISPSSCRNKSSFAPSIEFDISLLGITVIEIIT